MADQVVLKHIREARGEVPLDQLEIELRLNKPLTRAAFDNLNDALSTAKWERESSVESTDCMFGDVRVTDGKTAIRKHRLQLTDAGKFRVATCREQPVPLPTGQAAGMVRRKKRHERHHWGWVIHTTEVTSGSEPPHFEVEVELDVLYLVRRPVELLAQVGTGLMEDIHRFTERG